jgi:hypothetical protein
MTLPVQFQSGTRFLVEVKSRGPFRSRSGWNSAHLHRMGGKRAAGVDRLGFAPAAIAEKPPMAGHGPVARFWWFWVRLSANCISPSKSIRRRGIDVGKDRGGGLGERGITPRS